MTSDEPPPQPGCRPEDEAAATSVLDQCFDASSLSALRTATQACAVQAGMPAERATDVVIALHELAANAVRQAQDRGGCGYGTTSAHCIAALMTTAPYPGQPATTQAWMVPAAGTSPTAGHASPGMACGWPSRWPIG